MNTERKYEVLPEKVNADINNPEENLIIQPIYRGSILALDGFIRCYARRV